MATGGARPSRTAKDATCGDSNAAAATVAPLATCETDDDLVPLPDPGKCPVKCQVKCQVSTRRCPSTTLDGDYKVWECPQNGADELTREWLRDLDNFGRPPPPKVLADDAPPAAAAQQQQQQQRGERRDSTSTDTDVESRIKQFQSSPNHPYAAHSVAASKRLATDGGGGVASALRSNNSRPAAQPTPKRPVPLKPAARSLDEGAPRGTILAAATSHTETTTSSSRVDGSAATSVRPPWRAAVPRGRSPRSTSTNGGGGDNSSSAYSSYSSVGTQLQQQQRQLSRARDSVTPSSGVCEADAVYLPAAGRPSLSASRGVASDDTDTVQRQHRQPPLVALAGSCASRSADNNVPSACALPSGGGGTWRDRDCDSDDASPARRCHSSLSAAGSAVEAIPLQPLKLTPPKQEHSSASTVRQRSLDAVRECADEATAEPHATGHLPQRRAAQSPPRDRSSTAADTSPQPPPALTMTITTAPSSPSGAAGATDCAPPRQPATDSTGAHTHLQPPGAAPPISAQRRSESAGEPGPSDGAPAAGAGSLVRQLRINGRTVPMSGGTAADGGGPQRQRSLPNRPGVLEEVDSPVRRFYEQHFERTLRDSLRSVHMAERQRRVDAGAVAPGQDGPIGRLRHDIIVDRIPPPTPRNIRLMNSGAATVDMGDGAAAIDAAGRRARFGASTSHDDALLNRGSVDAAAGAGGSPVSRPGRAAQRGGGQGAQRPVRPTSQLLLASRSTEHTDGHVRLGQAASCSAQALDRDSVRPGARGVSSAALLLSPSTGRPKCSGDAPAAARLPDPLRTCKPVYGVCRACGRTVRDACDATQALGHLYHTKCFTCDVCARPLRGEQFYELAGRTYCERDYLYSDWWQGGASAGGDHQGGATCAECQHPIVDMVLQAVGRDYHPGCFRCAECGLCLDGAPFALDATRSVYCVRDYHRLFAPTCHKCDQRILPLPDTDEIERVVAMNHDYHVECYVCEGCGARLTDEQHRRCYPLGDHLLCYGCHMQWTRAGGSHHPITDV